jgi:TolB-like protein/predicted Zn-dependent protease
VPRRHATPTAHAELDDRPAIAVLPFESVSDTTDQAHFADGLTDEIINELASWRLFPVIARTSTFTFKGHELDAAQIGRKLGARYIVHGSYDRTGSRLRVAAQLIDAATGRQLASDRFDQHVEEVFEVRDQIAGMVAGSIAPELLKAERDRISRRPSRNPTSYEYFLRGMEAHYRYTQHDNRDAQQWLRKSIEADPRNAQAHALLASAMLHAVQHGWRNDAEHNYEVADSLATRAVALDPRAPLAHFSLASTSMFLGRIESAYAEMTEAIRINPSHAAAHALLANLLCFLGRPGDALKSVQVALRLSPYDPRLGLWLPTMAQAHYFLANYEESVTAGRRALGLIPENILALRFTAASLGQLGRAGECTALLAALHRSTAPTLEAIGKSVQHLYRSASMIEHMLDGLRKAGLD